MPSAESDAQPSDVFDLGPIPARHLVGADQVRRLIAAQFSHWSDLPITPVAEQGWDNQTFHLGTELSVRLPSAAEYALAVEKEHRWLPVLRPRLPLPIPEPVANGAPAEDYPHVWSVYRWVPGEPASPDNIADLTEFGIALADFLVALRAVDPSDGPGPGVHNWYRGGPLTTYSSGVRRDLETLADHIRTDLAEEIWQMALESAWDGQPVWFHGDMASGNLLVREGALAAVIDFGTCGVGDPACDLAIAWTLLTEPSRTAFRDRLSVDPASWARGRGWALWKALATYASSISDGESGSDSRRVLDEILAE